MLHVGSGAFQSGGRRYPVNFDWLLPARTYVPVWCPSCDGEAPLVAGKPKLGCETPAVRTSSRRNFGRTALLPAPVLSACPSSRASPRQACRRGRSQLSSGSGLVSRFRGNASAAVGVRRQAVHRVS